MCTLQEKLYPKGSYLLIDNIVTGANFRGLGLASKLIRFVIQEFNQWELRLEAKKDLIEYYSRFGFQRTMKSMVYDSCTYFEMVN